MPKIMRCGRDFLSALRVRELLFKSEQKSSVLKLETMSRSLAARSPNTYDYEPMGSSRLQGRLQRLQRCESLLSQLAAFFIQDKLNPEMWFSSQLPLAAAVISLCNLLNKQAVQWLEPALRTRKQDCCAPWDVT